MNQPKGSTSDGALSLCAARQPRLAPLRQREHQPLLAGGLHAVLAHRQRAVGEALRLLDLDQVHRLAQRLHDCEARHRLAVENVELLDLQPQIVLGGGDVGERDVSEPDLGRGRIGELRRSGGNQLGQGEIGHGRQGLG
ncbi:MAG: hypothetical protein O3A06_02520 [Proteobacteria bacterium]|nr:hypothetical protein [Pseudomonadota bacterium]